jgi:hypothetical protein
MLLVVIIMFYNVLWGFSIDPLILVITRQNRKTLFCVFLCFRNLPELKSTQDFWSVNILSREPAGDQEVNETRPRGQTPSGDFLQPLFCIFRVSPSPRLGIVEGGVYI